MVNRAVAKAYKSAALQAAIEQALLDCVVKLIILDTVATRTVETSNFTVPVDKWGRQEIEIGLLGKTNMEERFVKTIKVVDEKRIRNLRLLGSENRFSYVPEPPTDISEYKKDSSKTYSTSTSPTRLDICHYENRYGM